MNNKVVLILGAGGFVGPYLIEEFKNNGYTVVASDIVAPKTPIANVRYQILDLLNVAQIADFLEEIKPDFLVNLAAISSVGLSWKIPQKTMEVNVIGTLNLLEIIHTKVPECRLLLVGSSEEYAIKSTPLCEEDVINANNPYGISKIAQENFASLYRQKYGMSIVCTRSFNHTGIGQTTQFVIPSFCEQVAIIDRSGKPGTIHVGNLSAYRDISDVRDIVHVYRMLLENPSENTLFNVGSGKAHKIEDLLKFIISLSSQKVDIAIDPQKMRPIDNIYHCCDNTRIKKFWKGTDIQQTIREIYNYYRGQR